jgi:lipopolysaccharide/colanic/teichoic acid biosynthesis glycosyltransferase
MGKVSMDELQENWFLEKIKPKDGLYPLFKRIVDIGLAFIVFTITFLFWPFIIVSIKLSSKGPIFFLKERVGLREKKFVLYKFRTMRESEDLKNEIEENFSLERGDEKRIFPAGRLMRRLRIDEWPQTINVLKGDLSFVGPRADFTDYYNLLKKRIPYYQIRTIIVPGLSGWAQIHDKIGNSVDNAKERLAYDIYYLKNRSFIMDVAISLKTLKTILTFSGI